MLGQTEEARKATDDFLRKEDLKPSAPINETQAEEEPRPWRGVFSPVIERDTLFTVEADLHTADLPSWEPSITINPRWANNDDE